MRKQITKPEYMVGPRNRTDIAKFLTSEDGWQERHYDDGYLFCFNVKLHGLDLSFDHLLEVAKENGIDVSPDDAGWVERTIDRYNETYDNGGGGIEYLWQAAVEEAQGNFVGGGGCPDDDSYNMLWDGTEVHARFGFKGRSNGWLVLKEFGVKNGPIYKLTPNDVMFTDSADDEPTYISIMDYRTLRGLDEYLRFVSNSVKNPEKAVEEIAASFFFGSICEDIQTTEDLVMAEIGAGI